MADDKEGMELLDIVLAQSRLKDMAKLNFAKDELLASIQASARAAGLDKMTDEEIQEEIDAYRRSKAESP